jgi:membrane-associated protease RseP (regulator of RpoE activity)
MLRFSGRIASRLAWFRQYTADLCEIQGFDYEYPFSKLQFSPDGRTLAVRDRADVRLIRMPLVSDALLSAAKDLTNQMPTPQISAPSPPRTYRLGVIMRDVSAETVQRHRLSAAAGTEVVEVFPDSAAQAAGVRVGDVIVKVNGKLVANTSEAVAAIKDGHFDLLLDIIRDGAPVTTRAALDD